MKAKHGILHFGSVMAATMLSQAAMAQSAPPAAPVEPQQPGIGVEEIVVTAQRREERLQDVPIAITAITSTRLAATGVATAQDLSVVTPALTTGAQNNYFQPRLRGVGTGAFGPGIENPIATYIDGVYLALASVNLLSLSDIERVEVLKGPQGTLFGRNATGGLIQVVTRDPAPGLDGSFNLSYGNYEAISANGYIAGGSETLAANLSVQSNYQGEGYGKSIPLDEDTNRPTRSFAVRSKIVFNPGPDTKFTLSGDYSSSDGNYPAIRAWEGDASLFAPRFGGRPWDTNNDFQSKVRFRGGGGSLRIDQGLGGVRLMSLTSYRKARQSFAIDLDATPVNAATVTFIQPDKQFSQELQIASGADSKINWVIGGYYFNATGQVDPNLVTLSGPAVNPFFPVTSSTLYSRVKTESFAAFTQATVPLTDALNFTAGLRYTTEKRSLNAEQILGGVPVPPSNYEQEKRYSKPTWRVALDYKITPDVMIYTSYNRGFKSGGFNPTTPGEDPFKPEQLDAYEGGIKSELFDRKLRFNLAAFYYNYKNIQVPYFLINTIGLKTGPKATIYGVDFDFEAHPFQQLRLFGGLSLLHDKFGHYPDAALSPPNPPPLGGNQSVVGDATGNRLPFTSTFSGNIGAAYEIPVGDSKITLNGNLYHNSGFYAETDNLRRQPAYELVSGSIQWTDATGKLTVSVWGKNLTNEAVVTMLAASGFGTGASYQPPRTYGATLGYAF